MIADNGARIIYMFCPIHSRYQLSILNLVLAFRIHSSVMKIVKIKMLTPVKIGRYPHRFIQRIAISEFY